MRYVIRIVRLETFGAPKPESDVGRFVKWCDVNAKDGMGMMESTPFEHLAISFETQGEAIKYVCRQSEVRPLRDDGRPNRPLTAFTVSIEPVETLH